MKLKLNHHGIYGIAIESMFLMPNLTYEMLYFWQNLPSSELVSGLQISFLNSISRCTCTTNFNSRAYLYYQIQFQGVPETNKKLYYI